MGFFYTNVTLYKAPRNQVADFLASKKRIALISPTQDNFTVVYDRETEDQDTRVLMMLSESLSRQFKCTVWASLVHDSDIYMYWLYGSGKLLDTYNSAPGYFDAGAERLAPAGGDANKLCGAFEHAEGIPEVIRIFDAVEKRKSDEDLAT